ncbi:lipoprotein, partial [human gut metagenome]
PKADFEIEAAERMLFVGSCFADNLGRRFVENRFRATVNPFGVMYNPASILHTVEKCSEVRPRVAVFTLGTNHVYILKETGEIVDNCQKRPQRLFEERELSVDECAGYLQKAINLLKSQTAVSGSSEGTLKVIITVSPIRYAKYGYHGSQLSKATLLLAADKLVKENPGVVSYFPAYEIMNDELRDYRFYKEDMLHPSRT